MRVATVRGGAPPALRIVLAVDLSDAAPHLVAPPRRPRTRMLPVVGERFDDCTRSAECIGQLARVHPDAHGASCPPARVFYESIRRLERDDFAAGRPGTTDHD